MVRKLTALALLVAASCGTPEYRAERSLCEAEWAVKIPPVYVKEIYNETRTREVPTGQSICEPVKKSKKMVCQDVMRTETYTIPALRTVDRNEGRRDIQIRACAIAACQQKFGNAECKLPE
ncbi:hypothetical protein HJ526_14615 [Donghicola sp. C2-DW-16]|uniref:Lipoprotein n=1 Tax=Donghicola mangrovi TaxID=2729614 RepID=A0ABX2PGN1_9RHOB|nr:hypothetical protein [Donghicola mangrovi]NVO28661.1 hypothetical protein [Donghicola mangrovi]